MDSQGSDQNIVIQVIGEISNKSAPHRKFAQTFVLAGQTNGYFVLNDIFRYIIEEDEMPEDELVEETTEQPSGTQEPAAAVSEEVKPETSTDSDDAAAVGRDETEVKGDPTDVDQSDSGAKEASAPANEVNGTPVPEAADVAEAEEAPAAAVSAAEDEPASPEEQKSETTTGKGTPAPEKATEPEPAQATAQPTPSADAAAAAPAKPAAPKTWATLVAAANRVATPNVSVAANPPAAASSPAPSSTQSKTAQSTPNNASQAQAQAPSAPSQPAREPSPLTSPQDPSSGWQTAGPDHNKRQIRPQGPQAAGDNQNSRAYIKNVYESVDPELLRLHLIKYGELAYFDVSRQKVSWNNCSIEAVTNANLWSRTVPLSTLLLLLATRLQWRRIPIRSGMTPSGSRSAASVQALTCIRAGAWDVAAAVPITGLVKDVVGSTRTAVAVEASTPAAGEST